MLKNEVIYNIAVSQIKENNAVVLSSLDNNEVDPRSYKDYEPGDLSWDTYRKN